jgi:hypothetical protein
MAAAAHDGVSPGDFIDDDDGISSQGDTVRLFVKVIIIDAYTLKLACGLCNCKCTDPSPLSSSSALDKYGGYRPWLHYKKVYDELQQLIGKKPSGQTCGICHNTFMDLGLDSQYSSVKEYKKTVVLPHNRPKHRQFLASCEVWVREHNVDQDRVRLRSKAELEKAYKTLDAITDKGHRTMGPDSEFVPVGEWDAKLDGEFDSSNLVQDL